MNWYQELSLGLFSCVFVSWWILSASQVILHMVSGCFLQCPPSLIAHGPRNYVQTHLTHPDSVCYLKKNWLHTVNLLFSLPKGCEIGKARTAEVPTKRKVSLFLVWPPLSGAGCRSWWAWSSHCFWAYWENLFSITFGNSAPALPVQLTLYRAFYWNILLEIMHVCGFSSPSFCSSGYVMKNSPVLPVNCFMAVVCQFASRFLLNCCHLTLLKHKCRMIELPTYH